MRNLEYLMAILNTESNHVKISILEEIQLVSAAELAYWMTSWTVKTNPSTDYYHQLTEFK